jgi:DNA-binding NtrC family response regulator
MMPRMDGFELLKRLGSQNTMPPTIVLTAFGNIETAVQTMHDLGAFWFLEKPIQPSALKVLLERAATQSRLAEEADTLRRQLSYQGVLVDLVGTCPAMQQVFSLIRQVAPSRAAVLVTGESGTGQRTSGARGASFESTARRPLRGHQLRGIARNLDGERTVRP